MTLDPAVVPGLASAASWGTGDFLGGVASRRLSTWLAIVWSQGVGLLAAVLMVLVTSESMPGPASLVWSAVAGVSGVVALSAFYRALGSGQMGLVAPLASLIGAGLPALVGILRGDPLSPAALAGMAVGLVAVILVSLGQGDAPKGALPVPLVVISGLGFAGFFLFVDQARAEGAGVWWSLSAVRAAPVAIILVAAVALRRSLLPPRVRDVPLLVGVALGDLGGNVFFVIAIGAGVLSTAVILSSLYPVVTLLAAVVVLGERLVKLQALGVVLAIVAVGLIAAG